MSKYNVHIVEVATKKSVALIGEAMSFERAERREMTGLMRIDRENFFVDTVPVDNDPYQVAA